MKQLYEIYLLKHKSAAFVKIEEMDLTFEQFVEKMQSSYSFNYMWGYDTKKASK
jgi:hypothetical protein